MLDTTLALLTLLDIVNDSMLVLAFPRIPFHARSRQPIKTKHKNISTVSKVGFSVNYQDRGA